MPLYEYACPVCSQQFERLATMASGTTAECPNCEAPANRVISLMAPAMIMGSGGNLATATGGGCACGGNCACSA